MGGTGYHPSLPPPPIPDYMLIKCLFAHFLIHESHLDSLLPLSCPLPNSLIFACGDIQKEFQKETPCPLKVGCLLIPLKTVRGPSGFGKSGPRLQSGITTVTALVQTGADVHGWETGSVLSVPRWAMLFPF